jgi:hypothetical protein
METNLDLEDRLVALRQRLGSTQCEMLAVIAELDRREATKSTAHGR